MFNFLFKYSIDFQLMNKSLTDKDNRIDNLERLVETIQGANNILERELTKTQDQEQNLLNKIFQLTGVTKREVQTSPVNETKKTDFIALSKRGVPWNQVRENLEKEAYWKALQTKKSNIENAEGDLLKNLEVGEGNAS